MAELEHVVPDRALISLINGVRIAEDAPQGDDDKLRVLRAVLDVVGDDGHVPEVERGVDLVHEVQRRGLVDVQGKDQCKRAERL